jgi:hypothetical protein
MLVTVKTLTGRKQQFDITESMTVYDLKQLISEREGIEIPQIRMIHSGRQLNDTQIVSDCNIKAGEIIHLVLSLRGG